MTDREDNVTTACYVVVIAVVLAAVFGIVTTTGLDIYLLRIASS